MHDAPYARGLDFGTMGSGHEVEISKNLPGFVIPQYELGSDEKWTESEQLRSLNSRDSRLWILVQKRPDFSDFCTYSSEASHIRNHLKTEFL